MPRPKIVVNVLIWETPSFQTFEQWLMLFSGYVDLRLSNQWDCGWYAQLIGGCLLPYARDRAIKRTFEERPDFTHLLFIDSDITGLRADDVKRMVEWDVPIVMPLVPLPAQAKGEKDRIACENEDEWAAVHDEMKKGRDAKLVKRQWVGTGCTLIKREVLEKNYVMGENYQGRQFKTWFIQSRKLRRDWDRQAVDALSLLRNSLVEDAMNAFAGAAKKNEITTKGLSQELSDDWATEMGERFESPLKEAMMFGFELYNGGEPMGEDLTFGLRAAEHGFQSYVDAGIMCEHVLPRKHDLRGHLKAFGVDMDWMPVEKGSNLTGDAVDPEGSNEKE